MGYLDNITAQIRHAWKSGHVSAKQEANLRLWGKKLVRTRAQQSRRRLKTDAGRCCLGFAIDVFPGTATWRKPYDGAYTAVFASAGSFDNESVEAVEWPHAAFLKKFGVRQQRNFYMANDVDLASFSQIGRAILAGLD